MTLVKNCLINTCSPWPWRRMWKQQTPKKSTEPLTMKKKTLAPSVSLNKNEKLFLPILTFLQQGKGPLDLICVCSRKSVESMYSLCRISLKYRLRKVFLPRTFFCCLCEIEQVAMLFRTDSGCSIWNYCGSRKECFIRFWQMNNKEQKSKYKKIKETWNVWLSIAT